jgi:hypothetical protein
MGTLISGLADHGRLARHLSDRSGHSTRREFPQHRTWLHFRIALKSGMQCRRRNRD